MAKWYTCGRGLAVMTGASIVIVVVAVAVMPLIVVFILRRTAADRPTQQPHPAALPAPKRAAVDAAIWELSRWGTLMPFYAEALRVLRKHRDLGVPAAAAFLDVALDQVTRSERDRYLLGNETTSTVVHTFIRALGDLGDPRAEDVLRRAATLVPDGYNCSRALHRLQVSSWSYDGLHEELSSVLGFEPDDGWRDTLVDTAASFDPPDDEEVGRIRQAIGVTAIIAPSGSVALLSSLVEILNLRGRRTSVPVRAYLTALEDVELRSPAVATGLGRLMRANRGTEVGHLATAGLERACAADERALGARVAAALELAREGLGTDSIHRLLTNCRGELLAEGLLDQAALAAGVSIVRSSSGGSALEAVLIELAGRYSRARGALTNGPGAVTSTFPEWVTERDIAGCRAIAAKAAPT